MKKAILGIVAFTGLSIAQAGVMGPAVTQSSFIPYISGEAAYTWPQSHTMTLDGIGASRSNQGWGGRLGAGFIHPYSDAISFTGEIGGGYYGSQTQTIFASNGAWAQTNKFSLDGYDILVGGLYKFQQIGVFGQAGLMVENLRNHLTQNLGSVAPGGFLSGTVNHKQDMTQAFPEIKVGGIYNLTDNWGLSLAYMHVFGSTPSFNETFSATTSGIALNGYSNIQNPTLNSVMFGFHYVL